MCVKTQFIRIAKAGLPYKPQFNGIAMGSLQDSKPWQKRARERIHCFYSSYSDTLSGDKISKDGHALWPRPMRLEFGVVKKSCGPRMARLAFRLLNASLMCRPNPHKDSSNALLESINRAWPYEGRKSSGNAGLSSWVPVHKVWGPFFWLISHATRPSLCRHALMCAVAKPPARTHSGRWKRVSLGRPRERDQHVRCRVQPSDWLTGFYTRGTRQNRPTAR